MQLIRATHDNRKEWGSLIKHASSKATAHLMKDILDLSTEADGTLRSEYTNYFSYAFAALMNNLRKSHNYALLNRIGLTEDQLIEQAKTAILHHQNEFIQLNNANITLAVLGRCRKFECVHAIYELMHEINLADAVTYGTAIKAFSLEGDFDALEDAYSRFSQLKDVTEKQASYAYNTMLQACWFHKNPERAYEIFADAIRNNIFTVYIATAMKKIVSEYGKVNDIDAFMQRTNTRYLSEFNSRNIGVIGDKRPKKPSTQAPIAELSTEDPKFDLKKDPICRNVGVIGKKAPYPAESFRMRIEDHPPGLFFAKNPTQPAEYALSIRKQPCNP